MSSLLTLLCILSKLKRFNAFQDFYIDHWVISDDVMPYNNCRFLGGFDIYTQQFVWFGGGDNYTVYPINDSNVYHYNPAYHNISSLKAPNASDVVINYAYMTFIDTSTQTSYIYYTNYYYKYNGYENFFSYNIEQNTFNHIGQQYPKPTSYGGRECYTTDGVQYIYKIGGDSGSFLSISAVYKFDILNGKWLNMSSLTIPLMDVGCIYIENHLFVFGGYYDVQQGYWYHVDLIQVLNISDTAATHFQNISNTKLTQPTSGIIAIYPAINMITKDNWDSNHVFLYGNGGTDRINFLCNRFNWKSYQIDSCQSMSSINTTAALISFAYIDNQFRMYVIGGYNNEYGPMNTIQYAVLQHNGSICKWNVATNHTLDLNYFVNMTIIGNSQTNDNEYYRYTPCRNMLSCNGINDTVDLYNFPQEKCDRGLAVWNETNTNIPNYDIYTQSWQFIYVNGQKCDGFESVLTIIWQCNVTISSYRVVSAKTIFDCEDEIIIQSKYACN